MARRGDGIYLRGRTWWLDFKHQGKRYQFRLGKDINRTVAAELAQVRRVAVLRGEAGISRRKPDIGFDKAADLFLKFVEANRKPKTRKCYGEFVGQRWTPSVGPLGGISKVDSAVLVAASKGNSERGRA